MELFRIILIEEKDVALLSTVLKKAGIESRLMVRLLRRGVWGGRGKSEVEVRWKGKAVAKDKTRHLYFSVSLSSPLHLHLPPPRE